MNIVIATASQISLAVLDKPIYMMLAIIVTGIFQSPAKPMLDGIMMDHMDERGNFGKIRFFSILGSGFGTNLGGLLLTTFQKLTSKDVAIIRDAHNENSRTWHFWDYVESFSSGFNLLFFARLILTIPPIICIRQLQIAVGLKKQNFKNSTPNLVQKGGKRVLDNKTSEVIKASSPSIISVTRDVAKYCFGDRNHFLFFVCMYIAGVSGGVSDAFAYPRYQESGCSATNMGQSRLFSSFAGALMFWYSGVVTRRLGVQNVLFLSMICAGIRFSLLKRMDHPYYVYLVDFIRSTTYGAFWSSSTVYCSQIGPQNLRTTILLLLNGIYNGIGRSTGAIVGGKFQAVFGTNNLFLCCAWINYALAMVIGILYYFKSDSMKKKAR